MSYFNHFPFDSKETRFFFFRLREDFEDYQTDRTEDSSSGLGRNPANKIISSNDHQLRLQSPPLNSNQKPHIDYSRSRTQRK